MTIPALWTSTLRSIQTIRPEAIIAGGCLRDLDNDRPVKDVDIFVRGNRLDDLYMLQVRLTEMGHPCEPIDGQKIYPLGEGNDVVGYVELALYADPPIQIIMLRENGELVIDRMDYGICRMTWDGSELVTHPDYVRDKADQVFRLRVDRGPEGLAASVHRYARLVRKYEGWKFVAFTEDF